MTSLQWCSRCFWILPISKRTVKTSERKSWLLATKWQGWNMFLLSANHPLPSKCQLPACFSSSRSLFSPTICSNKSCTIRTSWIWGLQSPRHSTNFPKESRANSVPKLGVNCSVDSWLYHNLCKLVNICTLRWANWRSCFSLWISAILFSTFLLCLHLRASCRNFSTWILRIKPWHRTSSVTGIYAIQIIRRKNWAHTSVKSCEIMNQIQHEI